MANSANQRAGAGAAAEIRIDKDSISINGTFHTPHAAAQSLLSRAREVLEEVLGYSGGS